MHHFDGAAGEAEGHGPEGALTGPVGYLVECRSGYGVRGFLGWEGEEGTYNAYCITPFLPSCDGSGTSRRGLPVMLIPGAGASCVVRALAGFDEEEEIAAIDR